jgi:hypothetical protein
MTVLTGSADGTAKLWTPPPPILDEPKHITLMVQVLTGMELDPKDSTVRVLAASEWKQRKQQWQQLQERKNP